MIPRRSRGIATLALLLVPAACGDDSSRAPLADLDRLVDRGTAVMAEVEADVERRTAACMKERGFDYSPDGSTNSGDPDAAVTDSRAERERVGFGYVNRFETLLGGGESVGTPVPLSENERAVTELSPDDQRAYHAALWGISDDPWSAAATAADPEQAGCYNASWVELFGYELVTAQHRLLAERDRIESTLDNDPAVAAARIEWRDCLRSNDVDVTEDEFDVNGALLRAVERTSPWLDAAALLAGDTSAVDELRAHRDELEALQRREIEIAVTDHDCAEPVREAQAGVRADGQRSWLRSNPAIAEVLDAFYSSR